MDFSLTDRESHFRDRVREFMGNEVRPRVAQYARELVTGDRWAPLPTIDALKSKAKTAGLWNLFMPPRSEQGEADDGFVFTGARLTNLEYALCAEEMGRIHWASEVFNCSAPDSGNMELLHRYGTRAQKDQLT
jgi:acyl-CoA dehydrogenase